MISVRARCPLLRRRCATRSGGWLRAALGLMRFAAAGRNVLLEAEVGGDPVARRWRKWSWVCLPGTRGVRRMSVLTSIVGHRPRDTWSTFLVLNSFYAVS